MEQTVDIETLGTKPNCVILSVGAVKFNLHSDAAPHSHFYVKLDVDQQLNLNRSVDDATLEWWNKQDQEIKDEALSDHDRIGLLDFVKEFNRYCVGIDSFWAQGSTFDYVILEDLYRSLREPFPINYWQIRDSRTLFKWYKRDPRKSINTAYHNALSDAESQSIALQRIYKEFDIERTVGR